MGSVAETIMTAWLISLPTMPGGRETPYSGEAEDFAKNAGFKSPSEHGLNAFYTYNAGRKPLDPLNQDHWNRDLPVPAWHNFQTINNI